MGVTAKGEAQEVFLHNFHEQNVPNNAFKIYLPRNRLLDSIVATATMRSGSGHVVGYMVKHAVSYVGGGWLIRTDQLAMLVCAKVCER